jgi:predicted porin
VGAGWSVSAGEAELSPGNRVASIGISHSLGRSTVQLQAHRGERNGQRRATQLIGATYEHGPYLVRLATSRSTERGNAAAARGLLALGADWSLSKRSALYATVARDRTGTTQARHGLELGLRHRF